MPSPPRSIVFVLANGGRGGMQAQVRDVAGALAERGHVVTLAVGGEIDDVSGVSVVTLPAFSMSRPWRFLFALRRLVRARRPDVLHGHGLRLAPFIRACSANVRLVTCHGLDPATAQRTVRAVRWLRVTFASCGEGPQSVLARYGLRSHILNNALRPLDAGRSREELNHEFGLEPSVAAVVLPARFSNQKNHHVLVEILSDVRRRLGEASPEVLCLGDGPLREEIAGAALVEGQRPLLRCAPYRSDAASWLAAADFFVLVSTWEGQPLVVLEALARGLSVVSCTPTGLSDLLLDGQNGRLVMGSRDVADVIVQWCEDSTTRPRNEDATTAILQAHSLSAVVDAHLALYDTLTPVAVSRPTRK